MSKYVNRILKNLERRRYYKFLSGIIYFISKIKGKGIKSVAYLKDLNVWEFRFKNELYLSTGPGWGNDYQSLLNHFLMNLGYCYLPKEGDVVVDVGAGVGEELMILSRSVGESGRVFAIEAHPKTFRALSYNNSQNKLTNTVLLNVAVSHAVGSVLIEDLSDSLANKLMTTSTNNSIRVDAITIEKLADAYDLTKINYLKVNIEGAEQLLIKGIGEAIHKIENIAISCHDFRYRNEGDEFFKTKAIVLQFLKEHNFDCIIRNTGNPLLDDYVYAFPKK
jgi:FkbM family methyltransferase